MALRLPILEKYLKKLLGKNDIEDALKKLDTLTTEEARMATAETLKVTNRVDNKVDKVDDKVDSVDDKVGRVGDTVDKVDDKVTVLIDGEENVFLWLFARS
jgi:methyl-accepting chemotaxis protein